MRAATTASRYLIVPSSPSHPAIPRGVSARPWRALVSSSARLRTRPAHPTRCAVRSRRHAGVCRELYRLARRSALGRRCLGLRRRGIITAVIVKTGIGSRWPRCRLGAQAITSNETGIHRPHRGLRRRRLALLGLAVPVTASLSSPGSHSPALRRRRQAPTRRQVHLIYACSEVSADAWCRRRLRDHGATPSRRVARVEVHPPRFSHRGVRHTENGSHLLCRGPAIDRWTARASSRWRLAIIRAGDLPERPARGPALAAGAGLLLYLLALHIGVGSPSSRGDRHRRAHAGGGSPLHGTTPHGETAWSQEIRTNCSHGSGHALVSPEWGKRTARPTRRRATHREATPAPRARARSDRTGTAQGSYYALGGGTRQLQRHTEPRPPRPRPELRSQNIQQLFDKKSHRVLTGRHRGRRRHGQGRVRGQAGRASSPGPKNYRYSRSSSKNRPHKSGFKGKGISTALRSRNEVIANRSRGGRARPAGVRTSASTHQDCGRVRTQHRRASLVRGLRPAASPISDGHEGTRHSSTSRPSAEVKEVNPSSEASSPQPTTAHAAAQRRRRPNVAGRSECPTATRAPDEAPLRRKGGPRRLQPGRQGPRPATAQESDPVELHRLKKAPTTWADHSWAGRPTVVPADRGRHRNRRGANGAERRRRVALGRRRRRRSRVRPGRTGERASSGRRRFDGPHARGEGGRLGARLASGGRRRCRSRTRLGRAVDGGSPRPDALAHRREVGRAATPDPRQHGGRGLRSARSGDRVAPRAWRGWSSWNADAAVDALVARSRTVQLTTARCLALPVVPGFVRAAAPVPLVRNDPGKAARLPSGVGRAARSAGWAVIPWLLDGSVAGGEDGKRSPTYTEVDELEDRGLLVLVTR